MTTRNEKVVADLKGLGMKGILVTMAENGQLLEAKCEMPSCYSEKGRKVFDPIGHVPADWTPTEDHIILKSKGGTRVPSNIRLAHKRCNHADRYRRLQIGHMLDVKGKTMDEIAEALARKNAPRRHGVPAWTATEVRRVIVS